MSPSGASESTPVVFHAVTPVLRVNDLEPSLDSDVAFNHEPGAKLFVTPGSDYQFRLLLTPWVAIC